MMIFYADRVVVLLTFLDCDTRLYVEDCQKKRKIDDWDEGWQRLI
jgi:hypothetical protein